MQPMQHWRVAFQHGTKRTCVPQRLVQQPLVAGVQRTGGLVHQHQLGLQRNARRMPQSCASVRQVAQEAQARMGLLGTQRKVPEHTHAAAAARPAHLCKQHAGKGQALLLSQRQGGGPVRHRIQVAADALQQLAQLQQGCKRKQR